MLCKSKVPATETTACRFLTKAALSVMPTGVATGHHAQLLSCCRAMRGNLLLARIVFRIDIVELQGRVSVNLHYDFAGGHRIVVHVGVEKGETAGGE
jgi:hypothetical protein